jgi:hypothetical protein
MKLYAGKKIMTKEGLTDKLYQTSETIAATTTLFSPRGPTVLCRTMKLYAVEKRSWRKKAEETLMTSEIIVATTNLIFSSWTYLFSAGL